MEQDAKKLLMERLDDCLKVHADLLDSQDIGSIYELQDLAQLHYYLKVEHPFTPAEVEALLSFQDPLEVARWCKEENTHAHSFPICEFWMKIGLTSGLNRHLKQDDPPAWPDKTPGPDYFAFGNRDSLEPGKLFKRGEIATVQDVYAYLTVHAFQGEMDAASLDDPLLSSAGDGRFDDLSYGNTVAERDISRRKPLSSRKIFAARPAAKSHPAEFPHGFPDPDKKPHHEKER